SAGGMNSSVVMHGDAVIAIHADENLDSSEIGRMVAVKVDAQPKPAETGPPALDRSAEAWRNDLAAISSSPVLVGHRLYEVNKPGNLYCVDANTGAELWKHKLAPDELHASPLYADGKLYVPMQNGLFYILRPGESDAVELCKVKLAGRCIGAPAGWDGKIYVFTTEKLYCFGRKGNNPGLQARSESEPRPTPGKAVALPIVPSQVLLRPRDRAHFTIRGIDANGFVTQTFESSQAKWAKFIPPTARVRSELNAEFNPQGELVAATATQPSAGAFQATLGELKGTFRGRI